MAWVECPNAPAAVAQVLNRDAELPILRLGHHHIVEDGVPVPEREERAYSAYRDLGISISEGSRPGGASSWSRWGT